MAACKKTGGTTQLHASKESKRLGVRSMKGIGTKEAEFQ